MIMNKVTDTFIYLLVFGVYWSVLLVKDISIGSEDPIYVIATVSKMEISTTEGFASATFTVASTLAMKLLFISLPCQLNNAFLLRVAKKIIS